MSRLFGTDGVRGRANTEPMDSDTILRIGRAAAHVLLGSNKGLKKILIAKDTRISGYMIETALSSGFVSMGADVLLCGPLPTPGVSFMTQGMRANAGVMISASHNPFEDNGIKFFGADGFKLADETEDEIEKFSKPGAANKLRAASDQIGKAYRVEDAVGRYTVYLKSCLPKSFRLDGLKVVVDSANGAAYKVAANVFSELGASLIPLGDKPNGININDNCGSLYPEVMIAAVKQHGADCGIALDGDADRVIMCDEKGKLMDGDTLLALCSLEAKRLGQLKGSSVVGTVMSNLGLEHTLKKEGIGLIRANVGDRYVLAEMRKAGLNFGGEQSGHIVSLDHNTTGDGLLTSLLVLSTAVASGKPLSNYSSIVERLPQELINVPVKSKIPFDEVPAIVSGLESANKELSGKGRVLLRYSGTENKARVMVEAEDQDLCLKVCQQLADLVEKNI